MRWYEIPLDALHAAGGAVAEHTAQGLAVRTTRAIPTERFDRERLRIGAYVAPEQRFRLPLRIDLTAKIDVPGLYVLLGDGHINFMTDWSDNRRLDDPIAPNRKQRYFDNRLPLDRFVTISIIYAPTVMQVLVDGALRYASNKERYMRSGLLFEQGGEGLPLAIACDKGTNLIIRSLAVTEYDPDVAIAQCDAPPPPPMGNAAVPPGTKPTFEGCIHLLPDAQRLALTRMDAELRAMRPMRFRRQLEKHGNKISYVASEYGFSYAVHVSGDCMYHTMQWYILTGSKPEYWHQKADAMEAVLARLAQADAAFARRMFDSLWDCVGCGAGCRVPRRYGFDGDARTACHGKLRLTMRPEDLQAAMRFIRTANDMAAEQG